MALWLHLLPLRPFARIHQAKSNNQSEQEENLTVSPVHAAGSAPHLPPPLIPDAQLGMKHFQLCLGHF